ncbi:EipA family protein [Hyphomicrobium sp.]|uniref:EipA family protein n=1 Tax=Hyphomicrobium sp. TaxID=82 RepID=UPI002BA7C776|nr:EipA family protein [Hyphomicrobium sp.]HRN87576.1 EipA family protein [Hyphomicrobium sp.]HRQ26524.1 EipA family protein [Hyphomicrobium sp.]
MKTRSRFGLALLGLAMVLALPPSHVRAEEACSVESFGDAVDDSAAALRAFSAETQPRLKQKLQELRDHKGWPDAEYEAKGLALVHDQALDGFDAQAGELLGRIDTLGTPDAANPGSASCAKLEELKTAADELMAVMRAKSEHLITRIDREIASSPAGVQPRVAAAEPTTAPAPAPTRLPVATTETAKAPEPQPDLSPIRRTETPRQAPTGDPLARTEPAKPTPPAPETGPSAAPSQGLPRAETLPKAKTVPDAAPHPEATAPASPPLEPRLPYVPPDLAADPKAEPEPEPEGESTSSWSTTTAQAVIPPPMMRPVPPPGQQPGDHTPGYSPPAPGDPPGMPYTLPEDGDVHGEYRDGEPGYSIDEIREVSRGFFGTISTSLASVIEYAFQQSGRPTAYVLGSEGGAAFLAGLRYGEGTLYHRSGARQQVYWHGPSIGYDIGGDGSRTLFLIYSLEEPEELFRRFAGVDGSAYLVGGVGMTLLRGGNVTMAPIRSGLGLRLGASIGYMRFTPRPTWNPF